MRPADVDDDLRAIVDRDPPFAVDPGEGVVVAAVAVMLSATLVVAGAYLALRMHFGATPPPPAEDRNP